MFFRKKEEPVKTVTIRKKNELIITMRDKSTLSWFNDDWDGKEKIGPWKLFYKWFFSRSGEFFVLRHSSGEHVFRRNDILRFEIKITSVIT